MPKVGGDSITTQAAIATSTAATVSSESCEKQPIATATALDVSTESHKKAEEKIDGVELKSNVPDVEADTGKVSESVVESSSSKPGDTEDGGKEDASTSNIISESNSNGSGDKLDDSGKTEPAPANNTDERDSVEKETDQLDHCYSRSAKDGGTTDAAMAETPAKMPSPVPIGDNADGTQPRGVGLTPPPAVPFLPSIDEKKPDSTSPLTVSNVITLPPSPPVLRGRVASPKENTAEEMDLVKNDNALEKDADVAVYSKSPAASPVAQNLSKFAKVPEKTKADIGEALMVDENAKPCLVSDESAAEKNNDSKVEQNERNGSEDGQIRPMETEECVGAENASKLNETGVQIYSEVSAADKTAEDKSDKAGNNEETVQPMEIAGRDESRRQKDRKTADIETAADSVLPGVVCAGRAEQPSSQSSAAVTSSVIVPRTTVTEGQDASSVAQTITVIHTSIATVTACKVAAPRTLQATAVPDVAPTQASYTQSVSRPCATSQGSMPVAVSATSGAVTAAQSIVTHVTTMDSHAVVGGQDDGAKGAGAQKQWPLLIKEQPLILQELLDQEKREQEKARFECVRNDILPSADMK